MIATATPSSLRDSPSPINYEAIGEPGSIPGAFDAVTFGSRLAVVWEDELAHVLRVTMVSEDSSAEDYTPGGGLPFDLEELSAVAGSEGTGLIVGYGDGRMRRLECLPRL